MVRAVATCNWKNYSHQLQAMETSCRLRTVYINVSKFTLYLSGGRIGICRRIEKEECVQRVLFLIIPNGIWSASLSGGVPDGNN
jgi:hypothetical protein